jgi:hypothetical protein
MDRHVGISELLIMEYWSLSALFIIIPFAGSTSGNEVTADDET